MDKFVDRRGPPGPAVFFPALLVPILSTWLSLFLFWISENSSHLINRSARLFNYCLPFLGVYSLFFLSLLVHAFTCSVRPYKMPWNLSFWTCFLSTAAPKPSFRLSPRARCLPHPHQGHLCAKHSPRFAHCVSRALPINDQKQSLPLGIVISLLALWVRSPQEPRVARH